MADYDESEGIWRTIGGRRVFIKNGQSLNDAMRESGKFGKKTSADERQNKIDSVHIDFETDNTLPGLNREDLEALGKEDKPVLLKKSIIDRNLRVHPEVGAEEYDYLLGQALYNSPTYFPGHKDDYVHLVSRINDGRNSLVLVEMSDNKDNYEIVHLFRISDHNLEKMKKS